MRVRVAAALLAVVVGVGVLYVTYSYRSLNWFSPPERLHVLDRTYQRAQLKEVTEDEITQRHPPGTVTFEKVGTLPPFRDIVMLRLPGSSGATTSAYLKWGGGYVPYGLLGGP